MRGILLAAAFLLTVVGANWAVARYGVVPVGFGLAAPAGVYLAGAAFLLRDWLQEAAGRRAVLGGVLAGTVLSLWVSPTFALASGAAFAVSESADFALYSALRGDASAGAGVRGPGGARFVGAAVVSNLAGAVLDSVVFLWIAFGALDFLAGQVVGKAWVTAAFVALAVAGGAVRAARGSASGEAGG